jgi:transglutaminase-like putative cysteine protease
MHLRVEHRFAFEYDAFISESFLELHVQPKTTPQQVVSAFELAVGPPTSVHRYRDWNDNLTHHFTITKFHDRIEVSARSLVQTHRAGVTLASLTQGPAREGLAYTLRDFLEFGGPVLLTPGLRAANRAIGLAATAPLGEQVQALGAYIGKRFEYQKNVTAYDSTTEDFLKIGGGVCQDFAHLMLGLLRLRGVPCRYVSGYLHVERKQKEPSQSHAWVEFHAPSAGWVPFDPTHNRAVDERYVVVGHGRHYDDVPPNKGIYRGNARETLRAEVHTQVTASKGVVDLHEEIRRIELPVYHEPPERRRLERVITRAEEAAIQQQQQQ